MASYTLLYMACYSILQYNLSIVCLLDKPALRKFRVMVHVNVQSLVASPLTSCWPTVSEN